MVERHAENDRDGATAGAGCAEKLLVGKGDIDNTLTNDKSSEQQHMMTGSITIIARSEESAWANGEVRTFRTNTNVHGIISMYRVINPMECGA